MNEIKPTPTPSQLRTAYQQKASTFLFAASQNKWLNEAARSLALRAIYPNQSSDSTEENENWKNSTCLACGTPSHQDISPTPQSKITLRSLKRGKTRRRRSSRTVASQYQKQTLFKQRQLMLGNNSIHKDEILKQNEVMTIAHLYRLGDGRCRHCIVLRCGYCGVEKKRKGVEVKNGSKCTTPKKIQSTKSEAKTVEKRHDGLEGNFISLPNNPKQPNRGVASAKTFPFKNKQSPLLSGGKKKKKAKSADSKLMDFLSSLND